jgi:protein TonB
MNNPYILPICFAAAAHGALLFGFTKNPTPAKAPKEITHRIPFVMPPPERDPVVIEVDTNRAQPKAAAEVTPQPVRSAEPLPVASSSPFTITPPPIPPVGDDAMRRILDANSGVPGGTGTALFGGPIVSGDLLDNPPRTRFQASPLYPFQGKKEGLSGEVFVDFMVDERGRVVEPRVVKSSHPMFDEPTLRAVAKWQFEPGRRDGRIVKFRMTVPVLFNLNEGS